MPSEAPADEPRELEAPGASAKKSKKASKRFQRLQEDEDGDPFLPEPSPKDEKHVEMHAPPTESTAAAAPQPTKSECVTHGKFKTLFACGMFMACSAAMMLVNKQVVKTLQTPVTILDMQLLFTIFLLAAVFPWTLRFATYRDMWRWTRVVPILYTAMLSSSMISQLYATVGLQVAIRNLGPLITLPIERVFNEPLVADRWTWGSLGLTLIGAMLYVSESIKNQPLEELAMGIILSVLNLIFAMCERLFQRKLIAVQPVDISKTGMLLLNNIGAVLPVSLLLAVPGLDQEPAAYTESWSRAGVADYLMLFLSGICGVAIGWTAINAQKYVTATTMLLITNLNKIVVVTVGVVFMGDPHSPAAIIGMVLALGGSGAYGAARNNIANKQKKKKKAEDAAKKAEVELGNVAKTSDTVALRATSTQPSNGATAERRAVERPKPPPLPAHVYAAWSTIGSVLGMGLMATIIFSVAKAGAPENTQNASLVPAQNVSKLDVNCRLARADRAAAISSPLEQDKKSKAEKPRLASPMPPPPPPPSAPPPSPTSPRPPTSPQLSLWTAYRGVNCFEGHGAVPVDVDGFQTTSLLDCKNACLDNTRCTAITITASGPPFMCYRRTVAIVEWCSQDPTKAYDTHLLRPPSAAPPPPTVAIMSSVWISGPNRYYNFYPARNCIDNSESTLCHSKTSTAPWLEIKFSTPSIIDHVEIVNRHDCCQEWLGELEIWVGDRSTWRRESRCAAVKAAPTATRLSVPCAAYTEKVTLLLPGIGRTLSITEMRVHSTTRSAWPPSPAPSVPPPPTPPFVQSPPPPPETSNYQLYTGVHKYRIGDMFGLPRDTITTDDWDWHHRMFPNSLATQYLDATDQNLNFTVMAQLVRARKNAAVPPPDTVVCHLRIGDVFEFDWVGGTQVPPIQSVDELLNSNTRVCWEGRENEQTNRHCYIKTLAYYERMIKYLPSRVTRAVFVAGDMLQGDSSRSSQYIRGVRNFFISRGFRVDLRLANPPDDDITYVANSEYFIESGGGFSIMLGGIVRQMGGTVLHELNNHPHL